MIKFYLNRKTTLFTYHLLFRVQIIKPSKLINNLTVKYTDTGYINNTSTTVERIIETFDTIYHFKGCKTNYYNTPYDYEKAAREQAECRQEIANYRSAIQKWLRESPINGNTFYTGDHIRNKLGKFNRTLYDVKGITHSYVYNEGTFYDDWQIDGQNCRRNYEYNLHTTPPPTPQKGARISLTWN